MDISMDISMGISMDIHIHGNPAAYRSPVDTATPLGLTVRNYENKKHLKNVGPFRRCEPPHVACSNFTLSIHLVSLLSTPLPR